jgi:hypothetical protein
MHQETTWPINLLSSSTHMGWLGLNLNYGKQIQIAPLLAAAEDLSPKQNLYDCNPSKSITCCPLFFKECRISVLPVPVYPPRILRLKDCSKPYYIIAESFVPFFNNINFSKPFSIR